MTLFHWNWTMDAIGQKVTKAFKPSLDFLTASFILEGTSLVPGLLQSRAASKHDQVTQGTFKRFVNRCKGGDSPGSLVFLQCWTILGMRFFFLGLCLTFPVAILASFQLSFCWAPQVRALSSPGWAGPGPSDSPGSWDAPVPSSGLSGALTNLFPFPFF